MITAYFAIHDRTYFNDWFKTAVVSSFASLKSFIT
jgi:hypothetical protein